MIQMRRARPGEEKDVAALWAKVYGDDGGFLEQFYALCAPFEDVMVLEEDGMIRTILTAPRVTVRCPDGSERKAGYMYALASEPAIRNRGFGRDMMRFGVRCLREEGTECAVLVPAEPSLFRFFDGLGYVPAFSHLRREFSPEELPAPRTEDSIAPARPGEYNALRRKWLEGRLYMDCPDAMVAFQQYLSRESGGDIYRLELPGGPGCAAVEVYDGVPVIKELLCKEADISAAAALLAGRHPAERYVLRLPPWSGVAGERVIWGAVLWLGDDPRPQSAEEDGYLGLALD